MMFGPENEVGSLYDHPFFTKGEVKEKAFHEARRVVAYIQEQIFRFTGSAGTNLDGFVKSLPSSLPRRRESRRP